MQEEWHVLLQAVIAALLGGVLGWERESAGKWAGLRTHILVSTAALLLVRLGQILIGHTEEANRDLIMADPSRIVESIITGIAFLGAGTIMKDPSRAKALGLTTAASLLLTATIGIAVALDCYVIAVGVTILCLIILRLLNQLEKRITPATPGKP